MKSVRELIEEYCQRVGISFLGIVSLGKEDSFIDFKKWIDSSNHADMFFLENYLDLREDPRKLFDTANTGIVFGMPYYLGDTHSKKSYLEPRIAQYARLKDYHKNFKKILSSLINFLRDEHGITFKYQITVDSAPVLERALASKTELGFIGKNTCYIHPEKGSFYLLGELIINSDIEPDKKIPVNSAQRTELGGCGTCRRCQVNCPTNALSKDYVLDANKCLSYWTIESRSTVPEVYWPWFKLYYFGCDICQLVCPYNRGEIEHSRDEWIKLKDQVDLFEVATMNQAYYEQTFGGSPMTRAKIHGLRRNALIAMTVIGDERLDCALKQIKEKDHQVLKDTQEQITNWRKVNS